MPIRIRDRSTSDSVATTRAKGGRGAGGASGAAKTGAAAGVGGAAPVFEAQLVKAERSLAQQDLDRLYLFVEYVVKNGLKLKSSLSARELHQIVERVDDELLGLADALLAKEQHIMELGAKIDQINGMLLDLKA